MTTDPIKTKELREAQQRERKAMVADLNETFATPHGRRTLYRIMQMCGYQVSTVVADPTTNEIQTHSSIYNAARVNLWLSLRAMINKNILIDVEHRSEAKDDIDLLS